MQNPTFDPGLTEKYTAAVKRIINKDGQFNVRRAGVTWRDLHPYLVLINMPFLSFLAVVSAAFVVVNVLFAMLYMAVGVEHLKGAEAPTKELQFVNALFFSAHTLTTVGYGNIYPVGVAANTVSAFEALVGLMAFAIATGLLFGRFARPSARIGFSKHMIVAPYENGRSLQFRMVNRRSNNLIELEARLLLMTVEQKDGLERRRYSTLALERPQILVFPLTWTVVHPIDERSPLSGKTPEELSRLQAEVMILIKAFDETFGQTVHARYSYRYDEIAWGAKFSAAFEIGTNGDLRVEVDKVSNYDPVPLVEP